LGDVRRDTELLASFEEAADVVALVTADRDSARGGQPCSVMSMSKDQQKSRL
jgi:hypothetical protein